MEFSFPKYFTIVGKEIKVIINKRKVSVDIFRPLDNIITIGSTEYIFTPISENGHKGGNSIILKLYESQNFDTDNIEYGIPDLVIKISRSRLCKIPTRSNLRFEKEISSLKICLENKFENIITLFNSGVCKIFNENYDKDDLHQYYTMEYVPSDLKNFIEENHRYIGLEEKIKLCLSISEGIKELNSLGYYHRDLKPDNIFFTNNNIWKIGDLGLVYNREEESYDEIAEFIGPRGWISPEAMNKYLCEGKGFSFLHNCKIDHQSDIFQLGKIFWYIFQHNAPIGTIKEKDFLIKEKQIYPIIKTMLNYSKIKRYNNIDDIISLLKPIERKLLKVS